MNFERDLVFGCELAQGRADRDGYVFWGSTRAHIHRWTERMGVPVPEGHVLDHLCRRRNCVALHHLEPVTQSENEKRKAMKYRLRRARCMYGHDLNEHRAVTPEGGVVCRACNRIAAAPINELIDKSSIGEGLHNIRENGLDAELADLERKKR